MSEHLSIIIAIMLSKFRNPQAIRIDSFILLFIALILALVVLLDTPDDIAYLYRLAQENPLLYAELACKPNGLQDYVDAMNEIN